MIDTPVALTVWQPYASLLARGLKEFETRGWKTDYRGPIYIHAASKPLDEVLRLMEGHTVAFVEDLLTISPENYPTGVILARTELVDCVPMTLRFMRTVSTDEQYLGDWRPGRFAWQVENIELLDEPVPCRGRQGLWAVPADILRAVGDPRDTDAAGMPRLFSPV